MVGVLSISSGYSPEYLLKEVATGRENYYTGAVAEGEPPGRWWGAGAEKLGLRGLVDAQDMRAVYERFIDPRDTVFGDPERWDTAATLGHVGRKYRTAEELYAQALEREPDAAAERRAELRTEAGKAARHNVAFFDITFSVQKSVTLLHTAFEAREVAARNAGDEETAAAWGQFRTAVEDAIWAGNNAALSYLQDKAGYTRVGHHGGAAGRYADAHEWTVASFFQHDSRDGDPQLHIHNGTLNRVEGPDGQWRTLDGRSLYRWRPAAAAVAERTTEETLAYTLGTLAVTRPDGKSREIVGVPDEAMSLLSSRRHKVTAKTAELFEAFEDRYGRAPNSAERDRLSRQATFATRAAKSHDGQTREEFLDATAAKLRADIDGGLAGIADTALAARREGVAPQTFNPTAVVEIAVADVRDRKAGWTRADVTRAVNAALPDYLGVPGGADVATLLDQLTDVALDHLVDLDAAEPGEDLLPADMRTANGESAFRAPGGRLYTTTDQIRSERILLAATAAHDGTALTRSAADRFVDRLRTDGIELGVDQAAAVRGILTSGARVETLVGPAGTGKSFVVGALARAWSDPALPAGPDGTPPAAPRRVFGLATSQKATEVLTAEGLTAANIARWSATQARLDAAPAERRTRDGDEAWRLREGDLVVVDESAMTDTASLEEIHARVAAAGAKLLLTGDHRQLSAVGAGGAMDLLATAGSSYELTDARRFSAGWERDASLRLREADQTVLQDYHQHGRLLDAGDRDGAEESAARAWLADTLAGRRSLLLVDSNDQAARVSAGVRAELVRLGRVAETGVPLRMQGTVAGVGDLVEARAIDWTLAAYEGNRRPVMNRDLFRVTAVRDDGALEVTTDTHRTGTGDRMVLPAAYVAEHLALGYAGTTHAGQGATVDTTHTVVTPATRANSLYVGMSRGRDCNTAHVTTHTGPDDLADGTPQAHSIHRSPVAAVATILDGADQAVAQSALATEAASVERAASAATAAERLADGAQRIATARTAHSLDQLVSTGVLTADERVQIAAEDGTAALTRILRRAELAGHDPHTVLADAVQRGPLSGSRSVANVLYSRIRDSHRFDPVGERWTDWVPRTDDDSWNAYLRVLAEATEQRAAQLGADAAAEPPRWAVDAFGEPPADHQARQRWQSAVGQIAAYREVRGHDDDTDPLGPAPQPGQVEQFAAHRAAWRALGRPEVEREHLELSNGQLRMRVRAYERELAAAPRYVGNELAGTRQAAARYEQDAALRRAEAENAGQQTERERLTVEAEQAAALARTLTERAAELQQVDDARGRWLLHTTQTRLQAELSKAELASRDATDDPADHVTAEEWMTAHLAAQAEDEQHREITEADLIADRDPADHDDAATHEANLHDAAPRSGASEDVVRVPTADEAADSVAHAGRVLDEIAYRDALDEQDSEQHDRHQQFNQWHYDDQTTKQANAHDAEDHLEPSGL
ncbi:MobF family relaxase [Pseudonocardia sp. Ae717_Ps2]|uniref:MobF family relaxase n=1 Tax=Pseudonocardia sp. Ae717_Ps2 TaxID=1885573 RepID=UPI00094B4DBA|nr:MobF family relaxase [Pseudonocardia sp. Ae717_Ps2]